MPTLSSVRVGEGDGPGAGIAGALPRIFFQLSQQLDTLARVLPEQSEKIDGVKGQLQEIMALAVQGTGLQGRDENQSPVGSAGASLSPYGG